VARWSQESIQIAQVAPIEGWYPPTNMQKCQNNRRLGTIASVLGETFQFSFSFFWYFDRLHHGQGTVSVFA
jgi:hypothetical protein